jgi:cyclohexa-1,5-dienecarbonyl-CoA hydratase
VSVRVVREEAGICRLVLDGGKGNVLGAELIAALGQAFAAEEPQARCLIIEAAGPDFSFGASVEEHRAAEVGAMLPAFHALLLRLLRSDAPVLMAVRGRCLGGGLELALTGSRIFAHPSAKFAQPEIALGVFAPAASALLPGRVGQAEADRLLLSGRTVDGAAALELGLVDELCLADGDPGQAALDYARKAYASLSRTSLRFATRAARGRYVEQVAADLAALERLYLEELMTTQDAVEGIEAFLQKRPPVWKESGERA